MPFYKEKTGTTPYYVQRYETRYFQPRTCERIYNNLKAVGINVHKTTGHYACELTFLDIYNAHVDSITIPLSRSERLKSFATAFLQ